MSKTLTTESALCDASREHRRVRSQYKCGYLHHRASVRLVFGQVSRATLTCERCAEQKRECSAKTFASDILIGRATSECLSRSYQESDTHRDNPQSRGDENSLKELRERRVWEHRVS